MRSLLRYGVNSVVHFDLRPEALLAAFPTPRGTPVTVVQTAVADALADPLDFPPLARAVVPGDRVVVALEPGVPQAETIVAAVVQALCNAGIEASHITVLKTFADSAGQNTADQKTAGQPDCPPMTIGKQRAALPEAIQHLTHDPDDRNQLSYLANIGEGKPVYLNRAICEADFVVPIGCLRSETSFSYQGVCDGVFPTFADTGTLARYRSPVAADSPVQRKRLRKQATEVGWLLGALFTLRVLPGPGDTILDVLAGDVGAVDRRGHEIREAAWSFEVPGRASLVVAAVEGGPEQQTWHNVARALSAARQAVAEGGTIAVCCDVQTAPGPALRQLASADSPEDARREIAHQRPSDALVANQLIHALENGRVYLLGSLEPEVVESLGVAAVSNAAELVRLAARHETCILLGNAQHAVVTVSEE
jgi:nickel-dependent lactate racemase